MYIPNAFSPNEDVINSCFKPVFTGENIKNYSITIYDRYSTEVFKSTSLIDCWNGRYKNQELSIGTYIYKITFIDNQNIPQKLYGKVILVR